MKVFVSWSGPLSLELAETMKSWLKSVIQALEPWCSSEDIAKGSQWSPVIARELKACKIGLICLTPQNIDAPWIMFESGALMQEFDTSRVCALLFNLKSSDLRGPLAQFQLTEFNNADVLKLMRTINNELSDRRLTDTQLVEAFSTYWPRLVDRITEILNTHEPARETPQRSDREILEEILALAREGLRPTVRVQRRIPHEITAHLVKLFENLVDNYVWSGSEEDRLNLLADLGAQLQRMAAFTPEFDEAAKTRLSSYLDQVRPKEAFGSEDMDDVPF